MPLRQQHKSSHFPSRHFCLHSHQRHKSGLTIHYYLRTAGSLSQTLPIPNTATASAAATNSAPQPQFNSSNDVTKIAVGIGDPFGVVIVGIIAALILWRQCHRKKLLGQVPETTKVLQPRSDASLPYCRANQQDAMAGYRGFEPAELQQPRSPQELEHSSSSTAQRPQEATGSSLWAGNGPSVGSLQLFVNRSHPIPDAAAANLRM